MKSIFCTLLTALSFHTLSATGFFFVDAAHPIHLDTDFRYKGKADFRKSRWDDITYADSKDKLYFSYFFNCKNSLSLGLGYQYLRVDWDKNPRFTGKNYNYGDASLTWITASVDKWRWIFTGGLTVDAKDVAIRHTGVGYGYGWGRYCLTDNVGVHVGAVGWGGMHRGYALPIIGIDWQMSPCWRFHCIFPHDISLRFYVHPNWSLSASYEPIGDYRYPRRAHGGIGAFDDAIFEIYARGAELRLNYFKGCGFEAGIGGGWSFNGWLYVRDKHAHRAKYYHYEGAPYGHAYLNFNF